MHQFSMKVLAKCGTALTAVVKHSQCDSAVTNGHTSSGSLMLYTNCCLVQHTIYTNGFSLYCICISVTY